ncbi:MULTISPECIES: hypothetical protein [Cupriavidus]|uniref:hypothetical protein n=1 Tax=Cupriavidus TaxID=106589 RepID=UPI0011EDC00F|nr:MULTISPECIES: hypothetical protein [Cupriavidus]MWL91756.1 hypothetical protein [Cupriavidus sp. SW-Y-13]
MNNDYSYLYQRALANATAMMEANEGLEPTSALKQAAADVGIPYGDAMGDFVAWANKTHFGA